MQLAVGGVKIFAALNTLTNLIDIGEPIGEMAQSLFSLFLSNL